MQELALAAEVLVHEGSELWLLAARDDLNLEIFGGSLNLEDVKESMRIVSSRIRKASFQVSS
jgi:hypothetical protein